jgi:hypothetical protein
MLGEFRPRQRRAAEAAEEAGQLAGFARRETGTVPKTSARPDLLARSGLSPQWISTRSRTKGLPNRGGQPLQRRFHFSRTSA